MKRKMISVIALSMIVIQLTPYLTYAQPHTKASNTTIITNAAKKYPNLINPTKSSIKPVLYSPEVTLKLNETIALLDEIDKNFDLKKLNQVFDTIYKLNLEISESDIELHKESDQIDYILYKSIYSAFTNLSNKEKNSYFVELIDNMYLHTIKRFNKGHRLHLLLNHGKYIGLTLSEYFTNKKTKSILINGGSMLMIVENTDPTTPPEGHEGEYKPSFPENKLPSKSDTSQGEDGDDTSYIPGEEPKTPDDKGEVVIPDDDDIKFPNNGKPNNNIITTENFKRIGKYCYKIITKYNLSGKKIGTKKILLSSKDKGFCGIYDNEVIDGDSWNKNHNGDTALDVWNSLSQNEINKLSTYSIYFTINKQEENSYFYDSGIRVSEDMTATYSQIRDALIQLSLKTNAFLIEDDDKLLFIAEGKPLVIKNKKNDFSKTEIESLLKSFKNISLKVDKLKETMHDDIENKTNEDSFKDIIINGEKITLTNQPIIENGILQLPIQEVTNKLGFKVENKKSKLILTKDEIVFEYEVGTKNIKMNDTLRILSTKSQVKNKVIYGEMAFLLREMGYILKYDDFKDTVEIRNK